MSESKSEYKTSENLVEKVMLRLMVLAVLFCFSSIVTADAAVADHKWGPAIGTSVDIRAQDDAGHERTVADLAGKNGLLLFLNRSADW